MGPLTARRTLRDIANDHGIDLGRDNQEEFELVAGLSQCREFPDLLLRSETNMEDPSC